MAEDGTDGTRIVARADRNALPWSSSRPRWWLWWRWGLWGCSLAAVAVAEALIALGRSWDGMALSLALVVALQIAVTVSPGTQRSPVPLVLMFAPLVRLMSAALWPAPGPAAGFQMGLAGTALMAALAAAARAARNAEGADGGDTRRRAARWRTPIVLSLPLLVAIAGVAGTVVRSGVGPGMDGFATIALLATLVQREFIAAAAAAGPRYRALAGELLFAIGPLLVTFVAVVAGRVAAFI